MNNLKKIIFTIAIGLSVNSFSYAFIPSLSISKEALTHTANEGARLAEKYVIAYGGYKALTHFFNAKDFTIRTRTNTATPVDSAVESKNKKTLWPNVPSFFAGFLMMTYYMATHPNESHNFEDIIARYCLLYGTTKLSEKLLNCMKEVITKHPSIGERKIKILHPYFFSFILGGLAANK